jgi:hypothetical protein
MSAMGRLHWRDLWPRDNLPNVTFGMLLASFVDFNNVGRGVSTRKSKLMYLTGNQSSRSVVAIREQSGH